MCGIGGIVSINNSVIDQKISNDIKNSLNHRGPDHSLIKNINPNCTFVHSRLAIIDLNPRSNQPLSSDDDKYHIVFNGEIYNYKELRSELRSLGYEFKSEGDTEVLLVGYQHFGKEILNKLIGQFAFVIADYNKNYYFMARDRIGLKPLYYSIGNQYFAFSSEFNTLNTSNLVSFSPNREAYVSYLRHLAIPNGSTGNENIQKVQPGEFIVVDFEGKIKKELYWDPFDFTTEQDITSSEAIDRLDNLLKSSVEYRKISDVEVGLYLSGGLDSTLIGSLLATDTKIKSFNVDYDEIFDGYKGEFKEAKYSADQINVELIHKSISFEEFRSIISEYSFLQDDLIGDEVGIPLYFLGKLTKTNGLKVVQVGEGADELFGGYLYFHNAPTDKDFDEETRHLVNNLYKFDVLRADRTTASNGLEVRVPFLDKNFINYIMIPTVFFFLRGFFFKVCYFSMQFLSRYRRIKVIWSYFIFYDKLGRFSSSFNYHSCNFGHCNIIYYEVSYLFNLLFV